MYTKLLSGICNYILIISPGTDRSNFLESQGEIENYPAPFENTTFWDTVKSVTQPSATAKDIAAGFFSSGYYCGT